MTRLTYGLLAVTTLYAGVRIGAGVVGKVLPDPQAPVSHLLWWQNKACAGIASAAYAVFFAMPYRMLSGPGRDGPNT